jgi:hypothetical protein
MGRRRKETRGAVGASEGARRATGCAWHGRTIGGESLPWDLLEVTMSRRQLHEEVTARPFVPLP